MLRGGVGDKCVALEEVGRGALCYSLLYIILRASGERDRKRLILYAGWAEDPMQQIVCWSRG